MGEGLKRACAAAKATQPPISIENARDAKKHGKVWVEVKLSGNGVPIPSGEHDVGCMHMKGAMTSVESFTLWMAAKKLDPLEIVEQTTAFRDKRAVNPPATLRPLLERLRDVGPDLLPASLSGLRAEWMGAGCPGL